MKQTFFVITVLLCVALGATAKPVKMSLQVRTGELRSTPSFLGKIVGSATYGDRFTIEETNGAWNRVVSEDGSLSGWLHSSALTKKKIKLKAGEANADVAASSGELALAGKGFNSDVEAEFKKQNAAADFSTVDAIEAMNVSIRDVKKFLKIGRVTPKGDAQ